MASGRSGGSSMSCYHVINSEKTKSCCINLCSNIFNYSTTINETQSRKIKFFLYSVSKKGLERLQKSILFLLLLSLDILALCTQIFLEDAAAVNWRAG